MQSSNYVKSIRRLSKECANRRQPASADPVVWTAAKRFFEELAEAKPRSTGDRYFIAEAFKNGIIAAAKAAPKHCGLRAVPEPTLEFEREFDFTKRPDLLIWREGETSRIVVEIKSSGRGNDIAAAVAQFALIRKFGSGIRCRGCGDGDIVPLANETSFALVSGYGDRSYAKTVRMWRQVFDDVLFNDWNIFGTEVADREYASTAAYCFFCFLVNHGASERPVSCLMPDSSCPLLKKPRPGPREI